MTTITIERAFLIKVLDQLDIAQSLLERSQHHAKIAAMYEELRAALAAPATAPDELERLKAESEERLQNAAALAAENEQLRWAIKDALAQLQRGDFADAESTLSVTVMKGIP